MDSSVRADAGQERFRLMTETSIPRLIRKMSIPPIISMLVTSIYNLADTFFVSQLSTSASGAVGVVFSLMAIIQAIGFTLGMGAGMNISRLLGRQDQESANRYASVSFFFGLALGIGLIAACLPFLDLLMIRLGATPTILPYALEYCSIILFGAPFMIASFVMNNILRSQGNAFLAMLGIGAGSVLNIILDPVFIFLFDLGIAGAAWATILGQFVSFLILLSYTRQDRGGARIGWSFFHPNVQICRLILSNGLPSFYRQILASLATIFMNRAAFPYGDAAIAAMSIVARLNHFMISAMLGFGQGFMPVCGFNYGAGRFRRVRESFYFCLRIAVVFLTSIGVVMFLFSQQIITCFRREDLEVIAIGTKALRLSCLSMPLVALFILSNMLTQSIGLSWQASLLSILRQGLGLLPLLYLLPRLFGLPGLQCAQPLSDTISTLICLPILLPVLKDIQKKAEAEGFPEKKSA